jgi:hypothetical protein
MAPSRSPFEGRGVCVVGWAALALLILQLAARAVPEPPPSGRYKDSGRREPPNFSESVIQWQVTYLLTNREPQDLIFLGDSSCLMGVVPEAFSGDSGLRCWNFGTLGVLTTDGHADLLELYLKGHPTPRTVVYHVSMYPLLLTDKEAERIGYLAPLREWLAQERGDDAGPLGELPSSRLRRSCRAWVERHFIRDAERQRFLNEPRGPYPSDREMAEILRRNRGYIPEQPWTMPLAGLVEAHQDYANPRLNADCRPGLKRMFTMAQEKGFELVVLVLPLPEAFRSESTDAALQQLEQDLHALAADYPRVSFREAAPHYLPNDWYCNLNHLRQPSAVRYSQEMGEWFRGRAQGGR